MTEKYAVNGKKLNDITAAPAGREKKCSGGAGKWRGEGGCLGWTVSVGRLGVVGRSGWGSRVW